MAAVLSTANADIGGHHAGSAHRSVEADRTGAHNGAELAASNYSQKLIEQKEKELRESILRNYSRIKDVERELGELQLQLKLTSGPKKHALELMRKKIELQNERVAAIRTRHTAAKQVFDAVDAELKAEEAEKDRLCGELNTLVMQSAQLQLNKLDELRAQLELLSGTSPEAARLQNWPNGSDVQSSADGLQTSSSSLQQPPQQQLPQQQQPQHQQALAHATLEQVAVAPAAAGAEQAIRAAKAGKAAEVQRQAEAKASRNRHVGLGGRGRPVTGAALLASEQMPATVGTAPLAVGAQAMAAHPGVHHDQDRCFLGFDS